MKRHLPAAVAAVVVIAAGALGSACDLTASAATAAGATISTDSLNTQLTAMESSLAGGCLLQLEDPQLSTLSPAGEGGSGTYSMSLAVAVLNSEVGDLLAQQFAASKGLSISAATLATATSDYESTLTGEIQESAEEAQESGTAPDCVDASGAALTGAQLLSGLPASVRTAQVHNQAVDELLLARGANLSAAAVSAYYKANQSQFTSACVSEIATDTQAQAQQAITEIDGGQSFAAVAKASSIDTSSAPDGGALGCNYTVAEVEQALQVQSITAGTPSAPVEDTSSGTWETFEVTSQALIPLSQAATVVRQELLQTTGNVNRVSKEVVAFARHASVSVNPQYGTWKGTTIIPPVGPPDKYLLAAASGQPTTPLTTSGSGGSGGSTTGSTGSAATGGS